MSPRIDRFVGPFSWLFIIALIAATIAAMIRWRWRAARCFSERLGGAFEDRSSADCLGDHGSDHSKHAQPAQRHNHQLGSSVHYSSDPEDTGKLENRAGDAAIVRILIALGNKMLRSKIEQRSPG
jgi:hypothetical protein